jgi:DNA polymerase III epsilon subunit family exonuclease
MSVRLNTKKLSEFVVVDIETNGLEHKEDHILSIGAVRFVSGVPVASFYSLSRPTIMPGETYTTVESTEINKITEALIEAAPPEKEVMEAFAKFVGTSITVGHNIVRFDSRFIDKALKRHKINSAFGWMMFDTFVIARSFKTFEKNSLEVVCQTLGIENKSAHHALADCFATGDVMQHFLNSKYKKTIDSVFVSNGQLKAKHLDQSPSASESLSGEKIVTPGWNNQVSRLEIAQSITDAGGIFLHDTLATTTRVLEGDLDKEDTIIRKSSGFGSATGKIRKAHELNEREDKNVSFDSQDYFVQTHTLPHTKRISELEVSFVTSENVVNTVTDQQDLAGLWSNWEEHLKTLPKVRVKNPSPQRPRNRQTPVRTSNTYGRMPIQQDSVPAITRIPEKSYTTAMLLSLFFGFFGVDRFYLGHTKAGIAKLFLCWATFGVWWLIDLILIALKKVDSRKFTWTA